MKKLIEIPDNIVEKLEIKTIKAKRGRKRYSLLNYITELLIKDSESDS